MHHRVASQRRMVGFDIHLHMIDQPLGPTEVQACGHVEIVLMLRRLLGLWLKQELPLKSNLLRIVDRHVHKRGQVVEFAFHIGIEQVLVSLATAPKHVIRAAEL